MSNTPTVLIIDDDALLRMSAPEYLAGRGVNVLTAETAEAGLAICASRPVDVVLLDHHLPDARGATLCEPILSSNDRTKIIFITAYPTFDNAVQALKSGAHDYLAKPFDPEELGLAVDNALRTIGLERVALVEHYKSRQVRRESVLIGEGLAEVRQLIDRAAKTTVPVLITGETGTGKSLVARCIHFAGSTDPAAYIAANCAAFPEHLIEAELFGYEKGAFTGALAARKGIFEMAAGGTLLLDEIGELPFHLQSKLLGVLDDGAFRRIGGASMRRTDARILAATNLDLTEAIRSRRFREDLYYRFGVLRIHVPALRDRPGDIPDLCRHFISVLEPDPAIHFAPGEIEALAAYPWPGNVRELKNIIERAVILRLGDAVFPARLLGDTAPMPMPPTPSAASTDPPLPLKDLERIHIQNTLVRTRNNQSHSARLLGISRSTLVRKIKTYNL